MDTAGLNLITTGGKYKPPKATQPPSDSVTCRFQYSDTQGDILTGNTRGFSMQSSMYRRLCSSASPMCQKVPILLLRHCGGTSKGIYGSEPSELPTSVFLPLLPISYSNCFGRRRICFLWNASTWLGTSDMIRYIIAFIHLNTGSGPGTQFVATDLLSNHKISCGTQLEHKPKDLPLNPLKDQVSYLVSSVAM